MGRYSGNASYGHRILYMGGGDYRICWTYDRYYSGSRLRHPQSCDKWTDQAGALRFSRKWDVPMPKVTA